jgi:hypothetical protein
LNCLYTGAIRYMVNAEGVSQTLDRSSFNDRRM